MGPFRVGQIVRRIDTGQLYRVVKDAGDSYALTPVDQPTPHIFDTAACSYETTLYESA